VSELEQCIKNNYSYCEGEGMGEKDLIRIYDAMKMMGEIKDYRFTYLGTTRTDEYVDVHELLHVRRNNGVVDVYGVLIRYRDGDVTRVRVEKLFSI